MKNLKKAFTKTVLSCVMAAAFPMAAMANVQVYVGYADGQRIGADFPNPFSLGGSFGANTVSQFVANLSGSPDSGTVMLANSGASDITITNLIVNDRATGGVYQIWTGIGAGKLGSGIVLHSNQAAIFAENAGNNFDSSDLPNAAFVGAAQTGTTFDPSTNNCSTGAIATSAACLNSFPILTFTVDGTDMVFNDTAHVLDTGGFDSAGYNHIHTGGSGVPEFNTNESLNWRLVGTTGINDPGGVNNVPEPASLALVGLGLVGFAFSRRRKQ